MQNFPKVPLTILVRTTFNKNTPVHMPTNAYCIFENCFAHRNLLTERKLKKLQFSYTVCVYNTSQNRKHLGSLKVSDWVKITDDFFFFIACFLAFQICVINCFYYY